MSPHDELASTPRTVDVDVSAILIHPRLPESAKPIGLPKSGTDQSTRSDSSYDFHIGPFGWVSINFVLGSCLMAIFCTLFVSENVQYFRRRGHLRDDIVYSPGDAGLAKPQSLSVDSSRFLSGEQLRLHPLVARNARQTGVSTLSLPPAPPPLVQNQGSPLSPNLNLIRDNGTVSNATAPANTVAGNGVSRATNSTSASSGSSSSRTTSVRSSATRSTRNLRKQSLPHQPGNSNTGRSLRGQLTNHTAKLPASKAAPQTLGGFKVGSQQSLRATETHSAAWPNQTSLHSLGQGGVGPQLRGSMNPMHMESGMLAEPAIGGVTGNGLGGAGHHAHVRR
jgi:hypothetical protein